MKRVVLVPSTFEGPWKVGFSCPIAVSPTGYEPRTHLVVVVPDESVTLPKEAVVIDCAPGEPAFSAIARGGLHILGNPPQPISIAVLPPPVVLQEPVILPEPSIVAPPQVVPTDPVVLQTPFFSRVLNFFKRP